MTMYLRNLIEDKTQSAIAINIFLFNQLILFVKVE